MYVKCYCYCFEMPNSLIITLCILLIHTKQASFIDHQNDYINNILNKLITSEKFDIIAEIIAEKAARKIQGLDEVISNPKYGEKIINNNRYFKQRATEDDIMSNETEESNPQSERNKIFHINPKVFIQLDASHPQKELSLNYKYLMKKSQNNHDDNGRNTIKNSDYNKKNRDSQKQLHNEYGDDAHRNKKITVKNGNKSMQDEQIVTKRQIDESSKSNEEEERVTVSKNYKGDFSNNGHDEEQSTHEKYGSKTSEETTPRNKELKKKLGVNNLVKSIRHSNEGKENEKEEMTEDYTEEKLKPFQGNNEMTILERKEHLKQIKKKNVVQVTTDTDLPRVTTTMSINHIREEAGKQLMYEPSPEYQEYFEKLAKSKAPNIEKFLT